MFSKHTFANILSLQYFAMYGIFLQLIFTSPGLLLASWLAYTKRVETVYPLHQGIRIPTRNIAPRGCIIQHHSIMCSPVWWWCSRQTCPLVCRIRWNRWLAQWYPSYTHTRLIVTAHQIVHTWLEKNTTQIQFGFVCLIKLFSCFYYYLILKLYYKVSDPVANKN